MKRCPECRRDYYDDSLQYCLDDGSVLLEGPAREPGRAEPQTAILHDSRSPSEAATRAKIHTMPAAEPQSSTGTASEEKSSRPRRVSRPIVFASLALMALTAGYFGYRQFLIPGTKQINSIAVLPFENKSGDADSDYLSDGLAESLIYRLSQLPNLKVIPTSSVLRYKDNNTDVQKIASELGVQAVMSGRLIQRGDNLTIRVELVDAINNKLIWGEQYERKMTELLATQREIVTEITDKLKLKLTGEVEQKLAKRYTANNEAYQLYLKGQYHYAKRTKEDVLKGIDFFEQAIQLDPDFALAYVAISDSYASMPAYPYLSPKDAFPKAKTAAEKALSIDPDLAEAHAALAFCLTNYDWNWTEAESEFKRSLALGPNLAFAHSRYGWVYLSPMGRSDDAIAELKQALELEPLALTTGSFLAQTYMYARQNQPALEQAQKTYELDQSFVLGRYALGRVYNASGMYAEAIALSQDTLQKDPGSQHALLVIGNAYAKSGRRREAENVVEKFKELAKTQYVAPYYVATIYAALNQRDQAFAELEKAYLEHDWLLPRLKVDPLMDPLRDDPRFKDLLTRMDLTE